jgi:ABC-2 type transport system permease protein
MLGKPLWLMMVLSVCLTTLPYAHRTMDDLPVALVDMDHSDASRELARLLDAAPKIAVQHYGELPAARRDRPGAGCSASSSCRWTSRSACCAARR